MTCAPHAGADSRQIAVDLHKSECWFRMCWFRLLLVPSSDYRIVRGHPITDETRGALTKRLSDEAV